MVEVREFIHPGTVFDPEAIQVLASALDDAWDRVQKSGSRFARPAYARAVREVVAKRIILETAVSDLLPTENRAFSMA